MSMNPLEGSPAGLFSKAAPHRCGRRLSMDRQWRSRVTKRLSEPVPHRPAPCSPQAGRASVEKPLRHRPDDWIRDDAGQALAVASSFSKSCTRQDKIGPASLGLRFFANPFDEPATTSPGGALNDRLALEDNTREVSAAPAQPGGHRAQVMRGDHEGKRLRQDMLGGDADLGAAAREIAHGAGDQAFGAEDDAALLDDAVTLASPFDGRCGFRRNTFPRIGHARSPAPSPSA
ncbi:protein of unknown function [Methylorubrum extorquens]|uniref:Uncharacterized protein n=1 Tax=Methylorubrum extorquens TaxID=408 RepID=A0A2N9AY12_METEX|nr:protein of unknown function [Methylorubrum extorquens]